MRTKANYKINKMKQLLLIFICVLFVFNSKAQDTSYYDGVTLPLDSIGIDTTHYYPSLGLSHSMTIRNDTIPVIMIMSDTSINGYGGVWQQRGYAVSGLYRYTYLDKNKQSIDKNIVVWMSQQIEPFK